MLTTEQQLARFLALTVIHLGGELTITTEMLDKMPPTKLVWDTSDPKLVKLSILSNDVMVLPVE
jgi:hypothetical protein